MYSERMPQVPSKKGICTLTHLFNTGCVRDLFFGNEDESDVYPKVRLTFIRLRSVISHNMELFRAIYLTIYRLCLTSARCVSGVRKCNNQDSVVGVAINYGLNNPSVGVRVPVR
jgi:hypothetical protein